MYSVNYYSYFTPFISIFRLGNNSFDDYDIVSFVRKNIEVNPDAIADFIAHQKEQGMNDEQFGQ